GGSSRLLPGSSIARPGIGFHAFLELLARTEGDDGARGDRDLLACLGVAAGALVLAAQVEVAETRQLHLPPFFEALAQHAEERVDELLRLALVEPDFLVELFGHFRLRQRHVIPPSATSAPDPGAVLVLQRCDDRSDHHIYVTLGESARIILENQASCETSESWIDPLAHITVEQPQLGQQRAGSLA